jgi:transposase
VDNYCIHKAKAVEQWLAHHPRFTLLWLPTYCPRANPIERVFGDVHDKGTRKGALGDSYGPQMTAL